MVGWRHHWGKPGLLATRWGAEPGRCGRSMRACAAGAFPAPRASAPHRCQLLRGTRVSRVHAGVGGGSAAGQGAAAWVPCFSLVAGTRCTPLVAHFACLCSSTVGVWPDQRWPHTPSLPQHLHLGECLAFAVPLLWDGSLVSSTLTGHQGSCLLPASLP